MTPTVTDDCTALAHRDTQLRDMCGTSWRVQWATAARIFDWADRCRSQIVVACLQMNADPRVIVASLLRWFARLQGWALGVHIALAQKHLFKEHTV